jgi:two-component system chemotaxis sensor kinase CheA
MEKYRRIFLEEANDHLAEISRALLDLEKEMGSVEAIDTIFRMAHSIKSMAASLGYDPVADLSHRMEDRMEGVRTAGRVRNPEELALLFLCLEGLESMVAAVSNEQEPERANEELLARLSAESAAESDPELEPAAAAPVPDSGMPDPVGGEPKKVLS